MATKSFKIWEDSAKDPKDAWYSKTISSINSVFNSNLPSNARITKVTMKVNADFDGAGGLANVYMKCGFGSTNSISKELISKTKITKDNTEYPSSGVDITSYFSSKDYPIAISTSNGSYLTVNINTANIVVTDLRMSYVIVSVTYDELVTVSPIIYPTGAGTVTGGGVYDLSTYVTLTAIPNDGYAFKYWQVTSLEGVTGSIGSTNPYTSAAALLETSFLLTAVFEKLKINKIYIGTSQPSKIYFGTQEVKEVYFGTTKVYG